MQRFRTCSRYEWYTFASGFPGRQPLGSPFGTVAGVVGAAVVVGATVVVGAGLVVVGLLAAVGALAADG
jgi:hypothetical protein